MRSASITQNLWLAMFAGGVLMVAVTPGSASPPASSKSSTSETSPLVVHEWGTFLSVQGSDGVTLGGMVDSEEVLPRFVEARGIATWQRSMMFQKMETPVTYFYTDRPRDVEVRVDMPQGLLTHWFPAVRYYEPELPAAAVGTPGKSYLHWNRIRLIPNTSALCKETETTAVLTLKSGQIVRGIVQAEDTKQIRLLIGADTVRTIAKDQIDEQQRDRARIAIAALNAVGAENTWRFARETDSAFVKVRTWNDKGEFKNQLEKFLFYRGLGRFSLPLEVRCEGDSGTTLTLTIQNRYPQPLRGLCLVNVQDGMARFAALGELPEKATRVVHAENVLTPRRPLEEVVPEVKSAVAAALVAAGLFPKEAQAMVNTWEKSYFRGDGLRVLYILPRELTDSIIPIRINPAPDKLERVMVGRVELLTPEREKEIERRVAALGSSDFHVRENASAGLARLGRLGEPVLRRVLQTTADPEVRARAEGLIRRFGSVD